MLVAEQKILELRVRLPKPTKSSPKGRAKASTPVGAANSGDLALRREDVDGVDGVDGVDVQGLGAQRHSGASHSASPPNLPRRWEHLPGSFGNAMHKCILSILIYLLNPSPP